MKFKEILSIAGQPGLYRFLTQGKAGIIVESLADQRRFPVSSNAKVSSLTDIAIYTETEDRPLSEIFQSMYEKLDGKEAIDAKSSPEELAAALAQYIPDYDRDRVHKSDIKKLFSWYNLLVANGMTEFVEKEEEAAEDTAKEE